MKYKKITESDGIRNFIIVFDPGDEAAAKLLDFAQQENVAHASFTALGAFEKCTFAFFDLDTKQYDNIDINEQVEVMSLVGNVASVENEPKLHAHVVIGKRNGTAHGGHLVSGHVRPTLEVSLTAFDKKIMRKTDETTGLPLIDLDAE
jgi:predicted DNA-binding protein with PD1-like motif